MAEQFVESFVTPFTNEQVTSRFTKSNEINEHLNLQLKNGRQVEKMFKELEQKGSPPLCKGWNVYASNIVKQARTQFRFHELNSEKDAESLYFSQKLADKLVQTEFSRNRQLKVRTLQIKDHNDKIKDKLEAMHQSRQDQQNQSWAQIERMHSTYNEHRQPPQILPPYNNITVSSQVPQTPIIITPEVRAIHRQLSLSTTSKNSRRQKLALMRASQQWDDREQIRLSEYLDSFDRKQKNISNLEEVKKKQQSERALSLNQKLAYCFNKKQKMMDQQNTCDRASSDSQRYSITHRAVSQYETKLKQVNMKQLQIQIGAMRDKDTIMSKHYSLTQKNKTRKQMLTKMDRIRNQMHGSFISNI